MVQKIAVKFVCQDCGYVSLRWQGQCSQCQAWNTFKEEEVIVAKSSTPSISQETEGPFPLTQVELSEEHWISTGIQEFDRVLGKGFIEGSALLLGGDPGIGKSTLALQASQNLSVAGKKVLYISGEESVKQLSLRAKRLGTQTDSLLVLSETNILKIIKALKTEKPDVLILDSIQVVYHPNVPSVSGSVNQVRQCAQELINVIKKQGTVGLFIGHITKDGQLAGPKVLEHLVDVILYLEGERNQHYRLLRGLKNRYSNTHEIGIFTMATKGLVEVSQPSEMFIDEGMMRKPGSVVSAVTEGSRVMLVEVQALVVNSGYGMAKRTFLGVDANRANLLIAAMEKIAGVRLSDKDIILNIVGGVRIQEPALDLAIVLAIISSLEEKTLTKRFGVFGEVSLTGEIRAVPHADKRLSELNKMGFDGCLMPERNTLEQSVDPLTLVHVKDLKDAIERYLAA